MPPNTGLPMETEDPCVPHHHPAPAGMKRVNSYWNEQPSSATLSASYWCDESMIAHGKHETTEHKKEKESHVPVHHPAPDGMKRVDSSYWKEPHAATETDKYWADADNSEEHKKQEQQPASTTTTTPHHHPAPADMKRVDSYWKAVNTVTETDNYWCDPMSAHGKHETTEHRKEHQSHVPVHHPAPAGMSRVDSYWKQQHESTLTDSYWTDDAAAHGQNDVSAEGEEPITV